MHGMESHRRISPFEWRVALRYAVTSSAAFTGLLLAVSIPITKRIVLGLGAALLTSVTFSPADAGTATT
uniref:hypothetical protein n=1 Tax=Mycobacterium sp. TaxID=1785 RepID=UPI003F99CD5C